MLKDVIERFNAAVHTPNEWQIHTNRRAKGKRFYIHKNGAEVSTLAAGSYLEFHIPLPRGYPILRQGNISIDHQWEQHCIGAIQHKNAIKFNLSDWKKLCTYCFTPEGIASMQQTMDGAMVAITELFPNTPGDWVVFEDGLRNPNHIMVEANDQRIQSLQEMLHYITEPSHQLERLFRGRNPCVLHVPSSAHALIEISQRHTLPL